MPYDDLPDLANLDLAQIAELAARQKLPPVDDWHPEATSDSKMRIAADGSWYHEGSPITRPAMIRAFLSILRKEPDGRYWLVTPHYKQSIEVEDVPFQAVDFEVRGTGKDQTLAFRLNDDRIVLAGEEKPLRFENLDREPRPYLRVHGGMDARLTRSCFYRLIDCADTDGSGISGVRSSGAFFPLTDGASA